MTEVLILLTTIPSEKKSTRPPRIWIPKKERGNPCLLPRRQQLNVSIRPVEMKGGFGYTGRRLQTCPFLLLWTTFFFFEAIYSIFCMKSGKFILGSKQKLQVLLSGFSFWWPLSSNCPVVPQVFIASTSPSSRRRLWSGAHENTRSRYMRITIAMGTGS